MSPDELTIIAKTIEADCRDADISIESAMIAWKIGFQAFTESIRQGASYPHHRGETMTEEAIDGLLEAWDDPRR